MPNIIIDDTFSEQRLLPYRVFSAILNQSDDIATSGVLIIGDTYIITELLSGDNFSNVGYVEDNVEFIATGTTPTTWTNSTQTVNVSNSQIDFSVLENTIGEIVWNRDSVGTFNGTLANTFLQNKVVFIWTNANTTLFFSAYRLNNNAVQLYQESVDSGDPVSLFSELFLEIRVYP